VKGDPRTVKALETTYSNVLSHQLPASCITTFLFLCFVGSDSKDHSYKNPFNKEIRVFFPFQDIFLKVPLAKEKLQKIKIKNVTLFLGKKKCDMYTSFQKEKKIQNIA